MFKELFRKIHITAAATSRKSKIFVSTLLLALTGAPAKTDAADPFFGTQSLSPLDMFQDCPVCPEMIVLPLGRFIIGAPREESEALARFWPKPKDGQPPKLWHEDPPHEVLFDVPIAMGRNEVTNEEWAACVSEGGCRHVPDQKMLRDLGDEVEINDPRQPVIRVSFYDVLEYTAWLNKKVGAKVYRPPTEAEWEYAARAGTTTRFAQGDTLLKSQANFTKFQWYNGRSYPDPKRYGIPLSVDALDAANRWGLRHMSGNVKEWTMSCFTKPKLLLDTSSAYLALAQQASECWLVGKGGAFSGSKEYARPAFRGLAREDTRIPSLGFRVIRELEEN